MRISLNNFVWGCQTPQGERRSQSSLPVRVSEVGTKPRKIKGRVAEGVRWMKGGHPAPEFDVTPGEYGAHALHLICRHGRDHEFLPDQSFVSQVLP